MQTAQVILAKKPSDPDSIALEETLRGHSLKSVEAFDTMFGLQSNPTRLCQKWLQFFKIANKVDEFLQTMPVVCYLHDLGKANSGFQEAVWGKPGSQVIRHEHLSGLVLWLPEIKQYFDECYLDTNLVVSAIIGHHLKAKFEEFGEKNSVDRQSFEVYSSEINYILKSLALRLGKSDTPKIVVPDRWSFDRNSKCFNPTNLIAEIKRGLTRFRHQLDRDSEEHCLLIAVRTALIVADSTASGLVREGHDISAWIKSAFDTSQILDGEAIYQKVIEPRVAQLQKEHGSFNWKDFQEEAEHLPERALMLASCGSGKTLAAWRWIKSRAAERPVARVIFLYPTRGTATEGFRDYISWAPEADAALIHGTSAFELEGMFENPLDPRTEKDFTTEDRLFALGYWQRHIFSATIDQFLGFMQHVYRSTCLMPLMADSVVVIDEVHSFDKNLFSSLKRFLKAFNVPVLCMTASLPITRQRDLKECGLIIFPINKEQFGDLQQDAEMPRYRAHALENEESAYEIVTTALKQGRRVLWVVNTVSRCQRLARLLKAICYHSRFKLEDRKRHHNKVVDAFQPGKDAILAVTTQVCEMSLDLDADVLITETAPITSLIQRMGRCNRHTHFGQNKLGEVYFYTPKDEKPYSKEELAGTDSFLEEIKNYVVGQARLEDLLEKYGPSEVEVEKYAAFLESGPWAVSHEETLREDVSFTVQAILDSDVARYTELRRQHKPTDGLIVPIPRYLKVTYMYSRVRGLCVAPASYYNPDYGFLDNPQEVTA